MQSFDVLVLLQQHAQIGHLGHHLVGVEAAVDQSLDPVDDLAGGGLLFDLGQGADLVERLQYLSQQVLIQLGLPRTIAYTQEPGDAK